MNDEQMARVITNCLEQHLHEYGWEPYRYPSGKHKGVSLWPYMSPCRIMLVSSNGDEYVIKIKKLPD